MMKVFFYAFYCIIIVFITFQSVYSGWTPKRDYLELDRNIQGLKGISYSKDGNSFYTYSTDNILRKWDRLTGNLTDSIIIQKIGTLSYVFFSSDKETVCITFSNGYYNTYAIRLNDYSIIDTFSVETNPYTDVGFSHNTRSIKKIDYNHEQGCFYVGDIIYYVASVHSTYTTTDRGRFYKISTKNDIDSVIINNEAIRTFSDYPKTNRSLCVNYDYYSYSNANTQVSETKSNYYISYSNNGIDGPFINFKGLKYLDYVNAKLNEEDNCLYYTTNSDPYLVTYNTITGQYEKDYALPVEAENQGKYSYAKWFHCFDDPRYIFIPYKNNLKILHSRSKYEFADIQFDAKVTGYDFSSACNKLIATNEYGQISIHNYDFFADKKDFSSSDTISYINTEIQFIYTGKNVYQTLRWDFGDGQYGYGTSVVHAYSKKGICNVSLTLIDSLNNEFVISKPNYIKITEYLEVKFDLITPDENKPLEVKFINKSAGEPNKYLWEFGDGTKDSTAEPFHKYPYEGYYTVKLTCWDGFSTHSVTKKNFAALFFVKPVISDLVPDNIMKGIELSNTYCLGYSDTYKLIIFDEFSFEGCLYVNYYAYNSKKQCQTSYYSIITPNKNILKNKLSLDNRRSDGIDRIINNKIYVLNKDKYSIWNKFGDTLQSEFKLVNANFFNANKNNVFGIESLPNSKFSLSSYRIGGSKEWSLTTESNDKPILDFKNDSIYFSLAYYKQRIFYVLTPNGTVIDTFSIPRINNQFEYYMYDKYLDYIITPTNSLIEVGITPKNYNTLVQISKFDKSKLIKTIDITQYYQFYTQKSALINNKYFAITGDSPVPGYLILDTNLNIVYNKRFPNAPFNFNSISYKYPNKLLLSCPGYLSNSLYLGIIEDTLPKFIKEEIADTSKTEPPIDTTNIQIGIYPNPADETIHIVQPDGGSGDISIFNIQGELLHTILGSNEKIIRIKTNLFPTGIYFCKYSLIDKVFVQKFMVLHK